MLNRCKRPSLWMYFSLIIFAVIAVVLLLGTLAMVYLYNHDIIRQHPSARPFPFFMLWMLSVLIGAVIASFVGKVLTKPLRQLSEAFMQLANGEFDTYLPEDNKLQEIRYLFVNYNKMVHELSNIETLRSDFVMNVSHEFKTPISSISGYAILMQDETCTKEEREGYISKILSNTNQLSKLAENMLSLSKLENQERVLHKTEYRLDEQLRKSVVALESTWVEKDIGFDLVLPSQLYYGNESLLFQVWYNIIDNAIKHSHSNGVIHITIEEVDSSSSTSSLPSLIVVIRDEGDGMSEGVRKHMFEKFYQGDNARKTEGHGLGLAIVKRIVALCGGSISVSSEQGQGTTFVVTLPMQRSGT